MVENKGKLGVAVASHGRSGGPSDPSLSVSAVPAPAANAGEVTWLRAILKRCEELTVLEEGDRDEAIDALANIRGLVRETLANGVPPVFQDAAAASRLSKLEGE